MERVWKRLGTWAAARSPRWIVVAGWIAFLLCAYPGYLSFDSIAQFNEVRSGAFTDAHPAVMSAVWALAEYVIAGPASMLALQGALFVVGGYWLLGRVVAPRVAALTACALLVWPPIFSPLSVIWPHSMMSAALVMAAGAFATRDRRWFLAGCAALVLASSCRWQAAIAAVPLIWLAISGRPARKLGVAAAIAVACLGVARLVEVVATDTTYPQQQLELLDVVGTLRHAHASNAVIEATLGRLAVGDEATLEHRVARPKDPFDWFALTHGDDRVIDPIASDDDQAALRSAWLAALRRYPGAYVSNRVGFAKRLVALSGRWQPVYDDFGDIGQLLALHHRTTPSDVELGMQWIVERVGTTVLFRPWLYVVLGAIALVLAWRVIELRVLVLSGLVLELAFAVTANSPEYRNSHWLVVAATTVVVAIALRRRAGWRAT